MEQSRELRQLFDACSQGNVEAVNSLLDGGFDVNAMDEEDTTALQLAAANGQEQVVRLLLVRGAAVDQANLTGWTPLLHAARNGHTAVTALLIQNHANVGVQTCYGAGVACLAARSGNLTTCRLLAGAGISFDAASGNICNVGSTLEIKIPPLVVAALMGHDSVIKHLLSSSDINYPVKPMGVTALMGAAVGGHVSTARLLVERGKADIDAVDINDKCALDYSITLGKQHVKEYLETKTTRCRHHSLKHVSPSIIAAVKCGNIDRVQDILEGDISQRDVCMPQDGATPLMFSAMLGHFCIVKLLVEKGCNINAQDVVSGWTPLMQAVFHGQKEIAVYLIRAGADVTVPAKSGCTVFDMAAVITDVDTELYRLIAAHAMPVIVAQQTGISGQSRTSSVDTVNHLQKTGVKAWWSRISKRFHNLKQPENISTDKHELTEVLSDTTLRNPATTSVPTNDDVIKSLTVNPLTAIVNAGAGQYRNTSDRAVKNDTIFSPDVCEVMGPGGSVTTATSAVPPIFPSPSFHVDGTSKMPPASLRKPLSNQSSSHTLSLTRPVSSGIKLLQNQHLTLNLVNRIASPPPRVQFAKRPTVKVPPQVDVSPSASCDAGTLGGSGSGDVVALPRSKGVVSSTSSSTLTAGSDNNCKTSPSVELLRSKREKLHSHVETKPNDGSPGQLFQNSLHNCNSANHATTPNLSSVGKDSGIGTGVVHHKTTVDQYRIVSECDQTDLRGILRKLSLQCYQPIFEEQEVDMEAFLTLTDCDLKELGIQSPESRRQFLAAINELNANKDREQRLHQKVVVNFNTAHQPQSVNISRGSEVSFLADSTISSIDGQEKLHGT